MIDIRQEESYRKLLLLTTSVLLLFIVSISINSWLVDFLTNTSNSTSMYYSREVMKTFGIADVRKLKQVEANFEGPFIADVIEDDPHVARTMPAAVCNCHPIQGGEKTLFSIFYRM